jgi:hypothetical protein
MLMFKFEPTNKDADLPADVKFEISKKVRTYSREINEYLILHNVFPSFYTAEQHITSYRENLEAQAREEIARREIKEKLVELNFKPEYLEELKKQSRRIN